MPRQRGTPVPYLAQIRLQKGLTQRALAARAGKSVTAIKRAEGGGRASADSITAWAAALGVPTEWLSVGRPRTRHRMKIPTGGRQEPRASPHSPQNDLLVHEVLAPETIDPKAPGEEEKNRPKVVSRNAGKEGTTRWWKSRIRAVAWLLSVVAIFVVFCLIRRARRESKNKRMIDAQIGS